MSKFDRAKTAGAAEESMTHLPLIVGQPTFGAVPIIDGFVQITDIANMGDGRLFVTEKSGVVRVVQPDGSTSFFMNIQDRVIKDGPEQGLLGIAFHPDYENNGYFYLTYIGIAGNYNEEHLILSRFSVTDDPNVANPNSEELIFKVVQTFGLHNGGGVRFNPVDGYLYLGVGDDSQLLVAQDKKSTKGKLLRLDVDNPITAKETEQRAFLDAVTSVDSEIVALGLRNPWKFGIDPFYGHIFIGDVGDLEWEEVDVVPFGLGHEPNFGWPCMEGPEIRDDGGPCEGTDSFSLPAYAYKHGSDPGEGCAIIGGDVYRPQGSTNADGRFIFGDFCSREVYSITDISGAWETTYLGKIGDASNLLTTFGVDHQGAMYAGAYASPGALYKLYIP